MIIWGWCFGGYHPFEETPIYVPQCYNQLIQGLSSRSRGGGIMGPHGPHQLQGFHTRCFASGLGNLQPWGETNGGGERNLMQSAAICKYTDVYIYI